MRASVWIGRNFSPARNVRSITLPSLVRRSLVRTKAPPLPGLTCWNSMILKTVPSTSMWLPFLNWFVEIMCGGSGYPRAVFAAFLACCALTAAAAPSAAEAYNFAVSLARQGPRPAASAAERAAHQRVAARFRAVGLRVGYERFNVPGKGPSRDVIGIRDARRDCLVIAMAHTDSVPPAPGADDNASGVGTLVALARALATEPAPACDVWLVATGAEERPYTGRRTTSGRPRSSRG